MKTETRRLEGSLLSDLGLWSTEALVGLLPGSTRKWWLKNIPDLIARGALRKRGKRWLGSRAAILAALVEVQL